MSALNDWETGDYGLCDCGNPDHGFVEQLIDEIKPNQLTHAELAAHDEQVRAEQREADLAAAQTVVAPSPWNDDHRQYWQGFIDATSAVEHAIRNTGSER